MFDQKIYQKLCLKTLNRLKDVPFKRKVKGILVLLRIVVVSIA